MNNISLNILKSIWFHLNSKRKKQIMFVQFLVILTSLFELLSIGFSVPFFNLLINPDWQSISFFEYIRFVYIPSDYKNALMTISILFGLISLSSGIIKLITSYISTRLTFSIGSELSTSVFHKILNQKYTFYLNKRSSEIISGLTTKINILIYGVFAPFLTLISSIVQLIFITILLCLVSFKFTLVTLFIFGFIYFFITTYFKTKINLNSKNISSSNTKIIQLLQESIGGIRNIIINNLQELYVNDYNENETKLRRAQGVNFFIGQSPKFIIESLAVSLLVAIIVFLLIFNYDIKTYLATIVVIFYGIQRLVPLLQQIYNSLVSMRGDRSSVLEVLELLELSVDNKKDSLEKYPFKKIEFKAVNFKYNIDQNLVLNNINFSINNGNIIGIIGESGSGKSTLLDLLLGLNLPTAGNIYLDNQLLNGSLLTKWRNSITHVSQVEHLRDTTFLDNITFGKEIDLELFDKVLRITNLHEYVYSLPEKYHSNIGERGVQISGGQRQRIAIARAIYKDSAIIILDEATSALDEETEKHIMNSLLKYKSSVTIILVTHRKSSLSICSNIYEVKQGSIFKIK